MVTSLTVRDAVAALKPKTIDQFSSLVIDGAERALGDEANPLRLNFFSTAMRILFEHVMDTLAPRDQIIQCQWFKRREAGKVPYKFESISLHRSVCKPSVPLDLAGRIGCSR